MKRKFEKFMRIMLASVMIFTFCFQSFTPVYAKTVVMDRDTAMSSYLECLEHTDNLGAYHPWGGKRVFKIDGKYAYCIESDVNMTQFDFSNFC